MQSKQVISSKKLSQMRKAEAKANNQTHYMSATPCKKCQNMLRFVSTSACVSCANSNAARTAKKERDTLPWIAHLLIEARVNPEEFYRKYPELLL